MALAWLESNTDVLLLILKGKVRFPIIESQILQQSHEIVAVYKKLFYPVGTLPEMIHQIFHKKYKTLYGILVTVSLLIKVTVVSLNNKI